MFLLVTIVVIFLLVFGLYWLRFSSYSQFLGEFPYRVKTDKKVVALTFDDGPNEPYTSQIVDFLNSKGIKATFFQVGKCVRRYPKITRHIFNSGHIIGNHSLSHHFSLYFKDPHFANEINETQAIIMKVIGKTPALFRPPWLYHQSALLITLKQMGLRPISGIFCHALEVWQPRASRIAKRAIAKAKPGSILIFHDGHNAKGGDRSQTVEAVKQIAASLQKQGYEFVTVDQLLGINAYKT